MQIEKQKKVDPLPAEANNQIYYKVWEYYGSDSEFFFFIFVNNKLIIENK